MLLEQRVVGDVERGDDEQLVLRESAVEIGVGKTKSAPTLAS
jgi:hypothetical protein